MKTSVIILAAGKGTRMKSNLPKVLVQVKGKPMIQYLVESVIESGATERPIIIVSPDNRDIIREALKDYNVDYAIQEEQLGTGHAVMSAIALVDDDTDNLIVLNGDHPFIKSSTIKNLTTEHSGVVTMLAVKLNNFDGWHKNFYHWGRIIREGDEIKVITEFRDASEEEKNITEVNSGIYCFDSKWIWVHLSKIKNDNSQGEYYLTDIIGLAFAEGKHVNSLVIDPKEAMGINSKEELEVAENLQ